MKQNDPIITSDELAFIALGGMAYFAVAFIGGVGAGLSFDIAATVSEAYTGLAEAATETYENVHDYIFPEP